MALRCNGFYLLVLSTGGERSFAATTREDRALRRRERVSGRDVEPRGNGAGAVHPEISKIRPHGRGGDAAGGGGIQAGNFQSHHAACDAQGDAGILPMNTPIGLAKRSIRAGFSGGGGTFIALTRNFPNPRCGSGVVEAAAALAQTTGGRRLSLLEEKRTACFNRRGRRGSGDERSRADNCCGADEIRAKGFCRRRGGFGIG